MQSTTRSFFFFFFYALTALILTLNTHTHKQYNRQHSKVSFTGINFYSRSRNVTQEYMDTMLQAARDRGLGVYMDKSFGTRTVDQGESCKYPSIPNVTTL
jgi:hypothetical protein